MQLPKSKDSQNMLSGEDNRNWILAGVNIVVNVITRFKYLLNTFSKISLIKKKKTGIIEL